MMLRSLAIFEPDWLLPTNSAAFLIVLIPKPHQINQMKTIDPATAPVVSATEKQRERAGVENVGCWGACGITLSHIEVRNDPVVGRADQQMPPPMIVFLPRNVGEVLETTVSLNPLAGRKS